MSNKRDTDRIEAFSDGVFAIAITLLILEIKVPPHASATSSQEVLNMLAHLWPSLLAFFLSFVTILIVWINHHWVFTLMKSVHPPTLFANELLLLAVTIIPFPTALLAEYLNRPGMNIAVAVYCATYLLLNLGFNLLWWSADSPTILKSHVTPAAVRRIRRVYLAGLAVYAASVVMALWSPYLGLMVCSLIWVLWAGMNYSVRDRQPSTHHLEGNLLGR